MQHVTAWGTDPDVTHDTPVSKDMCTYQCNDAATHGFSGMHAAMTLTNATTDTTCCTLCGVRHVALHLHWDEQGTAVTQALGQKPTAQEDIDLHIW